MKVTLEYLRNVCNQMAEKKIVPMPVYIAIIGDKRFMCPVSSLPDGLAPLPCEIVGAQFSEETGGTDTQQLKAKITQNIMERLEAVQCIVASPCDAEEAQCAWDELDFIIAELSAI